MKLFDTNRFLSECRVVGRLLRSYQAQDKYSEFFVVKLANSDLIQRYMIVIRVLSKENILRYEKSFEDCLEYLSYRCSLSKDDLLFIEKV